VTTVTLGELLTAAADDLAAATQHSHDQRGLGHLASAIAESARVTGALEPYLDEVIAGSGVQSYPGAGSWAAYLASHAREALQLAAEHLAAAGHAIKPLRAAPDRDLLTPDITAAADHLMAGHRLLRTHFTSAIDGARVPASRWAAALASRPVTAALLQEISGQTERVWRLSVGLSYAASGTSALYGAAPTELDRANRWLRHARVLLRLVPAAGHPGFPGRFLLRALQANQALAPQPLTAPESLAGLCQGITISTERLHATALTRPGASQSALLTAESWRWTATAQAVTAGVTEILLRSLAERVQALPADPFARRLLTAAADTAASARERWRHVTAAWGHLTTGTQSLDAPGITDTTDLLLRLGRLAYANPYWTPARQRQAPVRDPADLAPGPDQVVTVFTALHQAADALASLATADEHNVRAATDARQIYLHPDNPRGPAPATATSALLQAYTSAAAASTELAAALDTVALAIDAPSQTITAARLATSRGQEPARAAGPPLLTPTRPEPAVSQQHQPGPVEQRLSRLHIDNDILLQRAKAIDTAGRSLLAQAKAEASQSQGSHQAVEPRQEGPDQPQAAQNFPHKPARPAPARPAAGSSRQTRPASARPRGRQPQ
jgi:hypothetical protein